MKVIHPLKLAIASTILVPAMSLAAPSFTVTSNQDSGPGTLREALENGETKILIDSSVTQIQLLSTLVYYSEAALSIIGNGTVISGDNGSEPLLTIANGADTSLKGLELAGPGGYSIENQGGGKGLFIDVPESRTGTVSVSLTDFIARDTGNHGVHVSDCTTGDNCGAGQGGDGDGSPASIFLKLKNVEINNAGIGKQDADGIRVDDRGAGDITMSASGIVAINVGGDGIELDEGDEGSVIINVRNGYFEDNGWYCSADFVADPIALDPTCNDDGDPDVDDAFDIDEAGPGGIEGIVSSTVLINNYDEGLDFDSEGTGPDNFVDLEFVDIFARDNDDEAIKVSEEEDGSVIVSLRSIDIGGDVEVEEEDAGDFEVSVNSALIGDDLKLSEKGEGDVEVTVNNSEIADNLELVEEDGGDGTIKLRDTVFGDDEIDAGIQKI